MLERILRHVGLVRLDNLALIDYIKLIGPDIVVLIASIVVHTISSKLNPNNLLTNEMLPVSEPPHHNEENGSPHDNTASQRRMAILTMFGIICLYNIIVLFLLCFIVSMFIYLIFRIVPLTNISIDILYCCSYYYYLTIILFAYIIIYL